MSEPPGHRRSRVGVLVADRDPGAALRATQLARELGLPVVKGPVDAFDLVLAVEDDRVGLRATGSGSAGAVYADFLALWNDRCGGTAGVTRRQPLARAVGMPRHVPTVVDATAGLGRDGFQLMLLGCAVTAYERSPIVGTLLRDALRRARSVPVLDAMIAERFRLVIADARDALRETAADPAACDRPDVVFLDPMFPERDNASALAKKEMRVFRRLVGDDRDAAALLDAARGAAGRRVVVKRMRRAPALGGDPDVTFKGKITRYDVYLTGGA